MRALARLQYIQVQDVVTDAHHSNAPNSECCVENLLKFEHHNLGIRSQAQRWPPSSCSTRREHLHPPNPAKAIDELPVDLARKPTPGDELPKMRVPGELQRNAGSLSDFRMVGRMDQQNAGAIAIQTDAMKRRCQVLSSRRVIVGHPDDLQAVHIHFLVAEHANPGRGYGTQILA